MTGQPGVLFDVDGTLVDTNYLHTLAWSRAFSSAGEWAPMNAIHRLVGMGGDQLVPELLGHPNDEAKEARSKYYLELIDEARVFPGATDLVRAVHRAGVRSILATSSPGDELDQIRKLLDVDDALDAVTTADDAAASKPAPDIFLAAINTGAVDPKLTLVIGDSVWDVAAARAAGLGCVGVESGGFSRHELSEAGALHVYRDVRELLDLLETGPLAPLLAAGRAQQR